MPAGGWRLGLAIWLLGTITLAQAEEALLSMADPLVMECANPARPSLQMGAEGGLDAGLVGDRENLLLGLKDVGKQFYGTNDAVTVYFRATGEVTVELGIWLSRYGARQARLSVDGKPVGEFSGYAAAERHEAYRYGVTASGQVQSLKVQPLPGEGDYVHLDALRLRAAGPMTIVDRHGEPALRLSPALSPAAVAQLTLEKAENLARAGDSLTYLATEEFASSADGSRAYTAQAALDGDPDREYWAGGTPPPHALVLVWKQPVTFNTHRLRWLGENRGLWYGLEYWTGTVWQLLYEDPRNLQTDPVYQFPAVTTTRVRFTTFAVTGQQRMLLRALELYNLPTGEAKP